MRIDMSKVYRMGSGPPVDHFDAPPQFLPEHDILRWLLSCQNVLSVRFEKAPGLSDSAVVCSVELGGSNTTGGSQIGATPEEAAYQMFRWLESQGVL